MKIKKFKRMEFLEFMVWFVKMYEPDVYVELGVQKGYTFNTISPLVKKAIAVDINPFVPPDLPGVEMMMMTTDQAASRWTHEERPEIDLLFIDADHHKESVMSDFLNWSKFVREGTGFIFLHDTHPVNEELLSPSFCCNAWEAAREIRNTPIIREKFEIVTFPGPWSGMSIIRKSKKQLCWSWEK